MKKNVLLSTSTILFALASTGCSLENQWNEKHELIKQETMKVHDMDQSTTSGRASTDTKKINRVLNHVIQKKDQNKSVAFTIQGTQKLSNSNDLIHENLIKLKGYEQKEKHLLHLKGTINTSKSYEVWETNHAVYERMSSDWLKRDRMAAKRSPYDLYMMLEKALDSLEDPTNRKGFVLTEKEQEVVIAISKQHLDHALSTKEEISSYILKGLQETLTESNSRLQVDKVRIDDFALEYTLQSNDYQYSKIRMTITYQYQLNDKRFTMQESIQKDYQGPFNGKLKIPEEIHHDR